MQNPLPDWPSFELINIKLFADGCHVITATFKLNQSAMAKWYPEMEKLTLLEWQRFSYSIDFKYVKNGWQQKIGYFLRICMNGEQGLLSSNMQMYCISLQTF